MSKLKLIHFLILPILIRWHTTTHSLQERGLYCQIVNRLLNRAPGTCHAKQDRLFCPCDDDDDATAALDGSLAEKEALLLQSRQRAAKREERGDREGERAEVADRRLTMNADEIPKCPKFITNRSRGCSPAAKPALARLGWS